MSYAYAPAADPTEVMGRRIVAYLIDSVILGIVFGVALAGVKHQTYTNAPTDACSILRERGSTSQCFNIGGTVYTLEAGALGRAYGLGALVGVLNAVLIQGLTGASIGKLCLGLRVVDQQGRKANFLRMLARWLLLIVDGGCFLIGLITTLVTHPHRRVGDFAAGTYVVATTSMGRPIPSAAMVAPYGASGYATPGYGAPPGWAPPGAAPAPQWGYGAPPPPPPPSAPPGAQWGALPPAGPPQWNPPPPPPAPQWGPPPSSQPTAPPPSQWGAAPAAQPPAAQPPAASPWAAPAPSASPPPSQWSPVAPTPTPAPAPAPTPGPEVAPALPPDVAPAPQPESWWDKALPTEEPDGENERP